MTLGSGIALIVIGAILAFAVNLENAFIDLDLVGYILMGAGVVIAIIGAVLLARGRRAVVTSRSAVDPLTGERVTSQMTASDDPTLRP
jgi:membrane-bound ClpP family serine protease